MIVINYEDCNGCGECVDICSENAIILQNGKAVLDHELCKGCQVCIESCPQGAIICRDPVPSCGEVIKISEHDYLDVVPGDAHRGSIQDRTLPVLSSMLLWTGREILPRLANLALDYLDRSFLSKDSRDTTYSIKDRVRTQAMKENGRRVRQRRRRRQRSKL